MIELKNYKTFFAAAVLFALLTAIVAAYGYNSMAGTVGVIVAKQDITADKQLLPEQIGASQTPRGAVQVDTINNAALLEGKVAKGFIPAGTVLRSSMFQSVSTAGVRAKLKAGYVALALDKTIDTSCSDQIAVNSKVNIKSFTKEGTIENVATDIEVIAVTEKGMVLAMPVDLSDKLIAQKYLGKLVLELLPASAKEGV